MTTQDDYEWKLTIKGGPGSGHWGHAGRPGFVGGSVPANIAMSIATGRTARERQAAAAGRIYRGKPAGRAVSPAFDLSGIPGTRSKYGQAIRETLDAIDSVHGDGDLPEIPIKKSSGRITTGQYSHTGGGRAVAIKVSTEGAVGNDLLHEVGHFLDHQGFGSSGGWASEDARFAAAGVGEASPAMLKWFAAAKNSRTMQSLKGILKTGKVKGRNYEGKIQDYSADLKYARYMQRTVEVFARSYAQYIAIRSGNKTLLDGLRKSQARNKDGIGYAEVWPDDDFEPIASAFDDLLREQGWVQ